MEGPPDDDARERFTPALLGALRGSYVRRATLGPYFVYRPRDHGTPQPQAMSRAQPRVRPSVPDKHAVAGLGDHRPLPQPECGQPALLGKQEGV